MEKKKGSKTLSDLPSDNHQRVKRLLLDLEQEFAQLLNENANRKLLIFNFNRH